MIFSNIDLHRRSTIQSSNIRYVDLDKSLFVEGLNMLEENDKIINNYLKSIKSECIMSENASYKVFLEDFSIKKLGEQIFNFFVKAIGELFNKFKNIVNRIICNDEAIKKYEKKLKSMNTSFSLSFARYNYTYLRDNNVPNINLKTEFADKYSDMMEKMNTLATLQTKTERIRKMEDIEADINSIYNIDYFGAARARCINTPGLFNIVSKDYFSKTLFELFRDGGELISTKVTPTEITEVYDRYMGAKDTIKSIERLKNDTIDESKTVKKWIEDLKLRDTASNYTKYDSDEEIRFEKIRSKYIGIVKEICDMYVIAFSAKIDAVKESIIQDRKTLREAMEYIDSGADNI